MKDVTKELEKLLERRQQHCNVLDSLLVLVNTKCWTSEDGHKATLDELQEADRVFSVVASLRMGIHLSTEPEELWETILFLRGLSPEDLALMVE
jgi:hypothetical protein